MRKIKVTFISTFAYGFFCPGEVKKVGGQTRIYNLIRELATFPDYHVSCIVGDFGQPDVLLRDNVHLIKAPINKPQYFFNILYRLAKSDTHVYIDFIASPRLFLLYLLKRIANRPYIFFTASDADVSPHYRTVENGLYYHAYRHGLKHADRIVCQVPGQVQRLKKNYNLASSLILSPYFKIGPKPSTIRKNTILWVGRSAWYKRPDLFLNLAETFPQYNFVMICNESEYDRGFTKLRDKKQSTIRNLEFIDYVLPSEMEKYYQQAKILINTSDFEGFPNTFIEAAMHLTPILSLNVDPNGMLSTQNTGICCKGNVKRLEQSLADLLKNEEKLSELGDRAYSYAKNNHQLDTAVRKLDRIVKRVLQE